MEKKMKIIKPAKKSPKQDKHKPQYTKVFHMKLSKHYDLKIYLIAFFKVFFFFFGGPMHMELRISSHLPPCTSGGGTQVLRLGGRPRYPLSHLTGHDVKLVFKIFILLVRHVRRSGAYMQMGTGVYEARRGNWSQRQL